MSERDWQKDWDLCQRATPGPWKWVYYKWSDIYALEGPQDKTILDDGSYNGEYDAPGDPLISPNDPNGQFIAEAREALPYWLRRYKELHAKWFADVEEKIRLRYTNQQLQEELVRLKDIILKFARYADDHKVVLVCPDEASECNSLCSACWQAALDGRKEVKQDDRT